MLTREEVKQCRIVIVIVVVLLAWLQLSEPQDGTYAGYVNGKYEVLTLSGGWLTDQTQQEWIEYDYLLGMIYAQDRGARLAMPMFGGNDCLYTSLGDQLFNLHRLERIY